MKFIPNVTGSAEQAIPLIVGIDTVYVHTNIREIEVEISDGVFQTQYQYDEYQYTKDEYIKLLSEKNELLESQLTDTQLALVEIYEGMLM